MSWVYKQLLLHTLKQKFDLFYEVFVQDDASKKKEGDERDLLYQRLGHKRTSEDRELDGLVEALHTFLEGDKTGRESKLCTDQMLTFQQLNFDNPTDMSKWTTTSALQIEKKFKEAQIAMMKYRNAIVNAGNKKLGGKALAEMRAMLEVDGGGPC